jgi:cbb3-type cytochrome oxidase subunit 3
MSMEALKAFASDLYPYWQVLLFVIFIAIVTWSYWPSKKRSEEMRDHADIPLRDDNGRG